MKTTVEIPDALFREAKGVALKKQLSFKQLVTTALRQFLTTEKGAKGAFKLKDGSADGNGLQPGLVEDRWSEISQLIYEGRGE